MCKHRVCREMTTASSSAIEKSFENKDINSTIVVSKDTSSSFTTKDTCMDRTKESSMSSKKRKRKEKKESDKVKHTGTKKKKKKKKKKKVERKGRKWDLKRSKLTSLTRRCVRHVLVLKRCFYVHGFPYNMHSYIPLSLSLSLVGTVCSLANELSDTHTVSLFISRTRHMFMFRIHKELVDITSNPPPNVSAGPIGDNLYVLLPSLVP